jgi:hypothetical protein
MENHHLNILTSRRTDIMDADPNWKTKILLFGSIVGALTGLGAAYLLIQQAERQGEQPKIGTGEGLRLGMGVLGLLKRVGELGQGES